MYAQGGAISSPRTAETDQPTARMSSATACMPASGSRSTPSASASHSAHLHRSSWGLARRLRGGFMHDTLRGGYDIFGPGGALPGPGPAPASGPGRAIPRCSSIALSRSSIVLQQALDRIGQSERRAGAGAADENRRDLPGSSSISEITRARSCPQIGAEPAEYLDRHAVILADQRRADRCPVSMWRWLSFRACRSESSRHFLARGVNGMCPDGGCVTSGR